MIVNFDTLQVGREYDRPSLANLWGYQSFQAISKGVVTPSNTNYIILFVTKNKQIALQQYNDFIDGNLLFWEGEDKHGSDRRIVDAEGSQDEIRLFYRETHHTPFIYFGVINLVEYQQNLTKPSEFIFQINAFPKFLDIIDDINLHANDFVGTGETEKQALVKSRIGQGSFRENLIRLWGSCSLTRLKNLALLKASHIKPWRDSTNPERLNPYNGLLLTPDYDLLFDTGLIAFQENGQIIISTKLSQEDRHIFQTDENLSLWKVFPENHLFLEYHRDQILRV
jgi:putative restriction endonuclease